MQKTFFSKIFLSLLIPALCAPIHAQSTVTTPAPQIQTIPTNALANTAINQGILDTTLRQAIGGTVGFGSSMILANYAILMSSILLTRLINHPLKSCGIKNSDATAQNISTALLTGILTGASINLGKKNTQSSFLSGAINGALLSTTLNGATQRAWTIENITGMSNSKLIPLNTLGGIALSAYAQPQGSRKLVAIASELLAFGKLSAYALIEALLNTETMQELNDEISTKKQKNW